MASLRRLRRRLAAQEGSLLIEVLVSAAVLLTVSAGVVLVLQVSHAQSAIQRAKAIATDVAQSKLDVLRSEAYNSLRPLNTSEEVTQGGITFTVVSTATPVSQTGAPTGCDNARARDYMNLRTTVTWPKMGTRKPVVLQTMIAAPLGTGGGLVVSVKGAAGQAVPGIPIQLGPGGGSATTDASGCARWDAVSAGSGYGLTASVPGYVQPNGEQDVSITGITIAAEETTEKSFAYDRGGAVRVRFLQRTPGSTNASPVQAAAKPQHLTLSASDRIVRPIDAVAGSTADLQATGVAGLFYPWPSTAYAVYADTCSAAQPPASAPAAGRPTTLIPAGATAPSATTALDLQLPSLNVEVTNGNAATTRVHVRTACGTVYPDRTIRSDGLLVNPGLPYGSNFDVCVVDGTRRRSVRVNNTSWNAPSTTSATEISLPTSGGTCPFTP